MSRRGNVTFQVEKITPAVAKGYLADNRSNRPLSFRTVDGYAAAMRRGDWLLNGEAVKFDADGKLVDGQHRLAAVLRSDIACEFVVIRGLSPDVFKTLDTGRNRTASDVLSIAKVPNPHAFGVALRLLHRALTDTQRSRQRITNSELEALRLSHPRFIELGLEALRVPYQTPLLPPGQTAYAFYMACHVNEERAREFFRALADRPAPDDEPQLHALRLREQLTRTMEEIVKPAPAVRLAWVIQAWNASLVGRALERFSRIVDEPPAWTPEPSFVSGYRQSLPTGRPARSSRA